MNTEKIMTPPVMSLHFGRHFWLNDDHEFCSAPTFKESGEPDMEQWDYVSEWNMEGVNFDRLFYIHRFCVETQILEATYDASSHT
tara:strand:- start:457 stop:711 length:255 start_codon:yes stop_codon:yes gene_type:complete